MIRVDADSAVGSSDILSAAKSGILIASRMESLSRRETLTDRGCASLRASYEYIREHPGARGFRDEREETRTPLTSSSSSNSALISRRDRVPRSIRRLPPLSLFLLVCK